MPPFIMFILLTLCCHLSALPTFMYYLNPAISATKLEPCGFFIGYYEVFVRLKDLGNNTLSLIPQCSLKT